MMPDHREPSSGYLGLVAVLFGLLHLAIAWFVSAVRHVGSIWAGVIYGCIAAAWLGVLYFLVRKLSLATGLMLFLLIGVVASVSMLFLAEWLV